MTDDISNLENVYEQAVYVVIEDGNEIKFRVNENSPQINALLGKYAAEKFSFLTAYNPQSKVLPESENKIRQAHLIKMLQLENLRFLQGYGTNESESWQKEQSLFIFDISEVRALGIARKFEQHAIIFGEKGSNCRLLWC